MRGDSYSVNRFIAQQAMAQHPDFAQLEPASEFDFIAPAPERQTIQQRFLESWLQARPAGKIPPAVLISAEGIPQRARIDQLIESRDNRSIMVAE